MTLAEIADALEVKRPTAFNLTRTLVAHRYLERTGRPVRFVLGSAVLEAAEAWRHRELARHFESMVKALSARLPKAAVVLAEPMAGEVVAVHLIESQRPGTVQHSASRRLTPYVHASTLCFLAFWPPTEADAYEARYPFEEYGAGVWGTAERLHRFLAESRERGYVAWIAPTGRFLVGVPVYSDDSTLLAAVGVSVVNEQPLSTRDQESIIEQVQHSVRQLRNERDPRG